MSPGGRILTVAAICVLLAHRVTGQQQVAASLPKSCISNLTAAYNNYQQSHSPAVLNGVLDFFEPSAYECLSDLAVQKTDSLKKNIAAAREDLLTAVANYSPQAQQGATTSSASSVSPVSRLLGLTSIAEEFAGVNVSSASSSMTFSMSGQSLLEDLVTHDVLLPCSDRLGVTSNCIGENSYGFWRRFTPSVSAITSSATKGTANSTATPTPVTLSTPGSTWPSFGGFGLKGIALYRKGATTSASPSADVTGLLQAELQAALASGKCTDYQFSLQTLETALTNNSQSFGSFEQAYINNYPDLLNQFEACLGSAPGNIKTFQ
jgi:hypothetical protein